MFKKYRNTELFAPRDYGEQPCCFHVAPEDVIQDAIGEGGCGPGGFGDLLIPDSMYGLKIKKACSIHDWMYHFGKDDLDKSRADRVFLNNLIRIINKNTKNRFMRMLRYRRAKTYYSMVCVFGGPAFWSDKNKPEEMGE
jgi:hypothetical protein